MKDDGKGCLSCKLISIGCLLGIGGYLFYSGRNQPLKSKYFLYSLSAVSAALGVGECFNKSPFRGIS